MFTTKTRHNRTEPSCCTVLPKSLTLASSQIPIPVTLHHTTCSTQPTSHPVPQSQYNPTQIPLPQSCPLTPLTPLANSPTPSLPGSLPGLLTISDSDSDSSDDISVYKHQLSMSASQPTKTTHLSTETMAHYSCNNGKPPILTAGELTLELLADFKNGCYAYFSMKDVATDKQVAKITWALQDTRVQVWYRTNCEVINNEALRLSWNRSGISGLLAGGSMMSNVSYSVPPRATAPLQTGSTLSRLTQYYS